MSTREWDENITRWMEQERIPGLSISVTQGGRVLYQRGYGTTSVEDGGSPISERTVFRIGSVTKLFTGALAMRLMEQGRLHLDSPVTSYLPWFKTSMPGAEEAITMRRLLSHQAGLPSEFTPEGPRDRDALQRSIREDLPKVPMLYHPDERLYYYSNWGIRVAGAVLEAAGGAFYDQLLDELILKPLGMERTSCELAKIMSYQVAQGHYIADDGKLKVLHSFSDNAARLPVGGLFSTAEDMARFSLMLLGEKPLLQPDSIAEMARPQADLWNAQGHGYGLAACTERMGGMVKFGHTGWAAPCFVASCWVVLKAGASVNVMLSRHAEKTRERISDMILNELVGKSPETQISIGPFRPSLEKEFQGHYLGDLPGLAEITIEEGRPVLLYKGARYPLSAHERERLYFAQTPSGKLIWVGFPPRRKDEQFMVVDGEPCKRFHFNKDFRLSEEELERFMGTYVSQSDRIRIRLSDGGLQMSFNSASEYKPLTPLEESLFDSPMGLMYPVCDGTRASAINALNRLIFVRQGADQSS
ncbi:MAG TPA: serine hydrolase domain-containing protein [Clostridia bacterium]|nr:serine hydrolase domain-containing protein [Clostridia bacterium]